MQVHCGLKIIFASLILSSCEGKKNADPKDVAEHHNNSKFSDLEKQKEAQLIVDLAEFDLQQICLFKLAQQNSINKKTQLAGKVLESEYLELYGLIKDLGDKKQISVPSEMSISTKKICDALSYEIAEEFDKKLYLLVIKDHRDMISKSEKRLIKFSSPEVKFLLENRIQAFKKNLAFILLNYPQQ